MKVTSMQSHSPPKAAASGEQMPYSARRRLKVAASIPRVAMDTVDLYVAGASLYGKLGPAAGVLTTGLAVAHAAVGAARLIQTMNLGDKLYSEVEQRRNYTSAVGDLMTAAGFVGLSAGMGVWALPLVAVGELTSNYAHFA